MERNYDELFAEMLMSIDRHTEELTRHSQELTRHSQELTRHSQELTRVSLETAADRIKQDQAHERIVNRLEEMGQEQKAANSQHLEMLVNTATILDRIIKKNHLKL
jgi:hypothetical protein